VRWETGQERVMKVHCNEGATIPDTVASKFVEYLEPEFGAFGLLDPDAQHVSRAVG
jgi:hypothetical protein